jgi:hypothetical protein
MEKYVIIKEKLYVTESRISYIYLHFPETLFCAFRRFIFVLSSGVPRIFFGGGWVTPGMFFEGGRGLTNSVEDRGQRERGSWCGIP